MTSNNTKAQDLLREAIGHLHNKNNSECLKCLLEAYSINPNLEGLNYTLGYYSHQQVEYYLSYTFLKKELELYPNMQKNIKEELCHLLAWDASNLGKCDEAIIYLKESLNLNASRHNHYSDLIYMANHAYSFNDFTIGNLACTAYQNCFEKQLETERKIIKTRLKKQKYFQSKKTKIGVLSPCLHSQSAEVLLLEVFKKINLDKYEFYSYYINDIYDIEDTCTEEYRKLSRSFKNIRNKTAFEIAELILEDEIEILVDTLGHVKFNSLEVFSLKPAPIQISMFGYWGTTGLPQMDYLLVQQDWVKAEETKNYTEKIIEIKHFYCKAKYENIEILAPPCLKNNFVSFGCFNRGQKVNSKVLSVWSIILNYLPNSELSLSYLALSGPELKEDIWKFFEAQNIERSRIKLYPHVSTEDYFKLYTEIDIALDPFPFSGGCTSLDSLWMGVPVLTKAGDRTAGRFSESFLKLCEVPELIAKDESDYVLKAIELSKDFKRIQEYRRTLREKVRESGISNPQAAAKEFEKALDTIVELELEKQKKENSSLNTLP